MAVVTRVVTTRARYLQDLAVRENVCFNRTIPVPIYPRARKRKRLGSRVINFGGIGVGKSDSTVNENVSVSEQSGDTRIAQLVQTPRRRECSGRRIVQFGVRKPVASQAAAGNQRPAVIEQRR